MASLQDYEASRGFAMRLHGVSRGFALWGFANSLKVSQQGFVKFLGTLLWYFATRAL